MLRGVLTLWKRVEGAILNGRRGNRRLVSHVLEGSLVLELRREHLLGNRVAVLGHARALVVVVIVVPAFAVEIGRALMLVGSSIL